VLLVGYLLDPLGILSPSSEAVEDTQLRKNYFREVVTLAIQTRVFRLQIAQSHSLSSLGMVRLQ
jgi:hypothetical protein